MITNMREFEEARERDLDRAIAEYTDDVDEDDASCVKDGGKDE